MNQPRDLSHLEANRNGSHRPGQGTSPNATVAPSVAPGPPLFDGPPRALGVELLSVPSLNPAMLPESFRRWLADGAERMTVPMDYSAAAALVALAAVVGRRVCVRPKRHDDWLVCPNVWGAAVGPPSVLKSACIQEALRPLNRLAMGAMKQNESDLAKFKEDLLIVKAKADAAKFKLKQAAGKKGAAETELRSLAKEAAQGEEAKPPTTRRYIVNDPTVEKLGELLSENLNGLLLFRDELTGFLRSLDRQGHESDRGFYLESWNGFGSYVYDRIGRGTVVIPNICMSIFGGIQPGPLTRYLRGSASGDQADGFIPRFQLIVYPDLSPQWVNVDRWPDTEAKNRAFNVFKALDGIDPATIGAAMDLDSGVSYLGFAPSRKASSTIGEPTWRTACGLATTTSSSYPTWPSIVPLCLRWPCCSTWWSWWTAASPPARSIPKPRWPPPHGANTWKPMPGGSINPRGWRS